MDCSPPGSSVHGIFQARVLGWGAIAFSDASQHANPNEGSSRVQEASRGADLSSPLPRPFLGPFPWQFPHPAPVGENQNLPSICILCDSVPRLLPEDLHMTLAKAPSSQQTRYSHPPCASSCPLEPPKVKWFTGVSHSQQVTATGTRMTVFRFMLQCVLHCIRLFPKHPGDDLPPSVCLTGGG